MPTEAPAAPPPAAVPASVAPAPTTEIAVSTMPIQSTTPAKPGSARARMNEELRKRATKGPPLPEPAKPAEPAAKPPEPKEGDETPPAATGDETKPPEGTPAPAVDPKTGKPPKVNPWKLVEDYKGKLAKAEQELVEAGKRGIPKDQWEQIQTRLTETEKRNKELEDHIRFVDYSKSSEFNEKYQQPYEKAWQRAMSDLKDVEIDQGGTSRQMSADDLVQLVNMPLQKARAAAEEMFGPIANDVMTHRNEIKRLFDEQHEALENARKNGAERTKKQQEEMQRERGEMTKGVSEHWSKTNEAVKADPKYGKHFVPVEGDEQGNQRLAKGFELADRAFSENPLSPGLTAEQRRSIVERHAAVRNRAAAFGRLVYQNEQKDARIAELEKELADFKGGVPRTAGSDTPPSPTELKGMERIRAELRKKAV